MNQKLHMVWQTLCSTNPRVSNGYPRLVHSRKPGSQEMTFLQDVPKLWRSGEQP